MNKKLYLMAIDIDFRPLEIPPLPMVLSKQWYCQIDVLDVCMSVKHTVVVFISILERGGSDLDAGGPRE